MTTWSPQNQFVYAMFDVQTMRIIYFFVSRHFVYLFLVHIGVCGVCHESTISRVTFAPNKKALSWLCGQGLYVPTHPTCSILDCVFSSGMRVKVRNRTDGGGGCPTPLSIYCVKTTGRKRVRIDAPNLRRTLRISFDVRFALDADGSGWWISLETGN